MSKKIPAETVSSFDNDGDGVSERVVETRESTRKAIDWSVDLGWFMDLDAPGSKGERVVAAPVIRDGRLLFSTHVPAGDECVPGQVGWLMILDADSRAMLNENPLDIDGDGRFHGPRISGARNIVDPFADVTIAAGRHSDVIVSQSALDSKANVTPLASQFVDGKLTWRERQP